MPMRQLRRAVFRFNPHFREVAVARFARSLIAGSKVLDAGAGPCRYRGYFDHCEYRSQDFARYTGVEHTYGALDYICDIAAIPVAEGSFDAVLCTEVIEHIPRPDLAIAEFARIVRPGGKLFLTAPLSSGIHQAPYHYYGGFTPFWYRHFLPLHGFAVLSCEPNGGFFRHYGQESQRFVRIVRPRNIVGRVLFFPLEALLSAWFRLAMPLICHFLDARDSERHHTAGYLVLAEKL
jgi:SAM-dependent methyltransferase